MIYLYFHGGKDLAIEDKSRQLVLLCVYVYVCEIYVFVTITLQSSMFSVGKLDCHVSIKLNTILSLLS